jgi:hypothetical protein
MTTESDLDNQPLWKLEKIHHIYTEIIKDREARHLVAGIELKAKNKREFIREISKVMKEIFVNADMTLKDSPGDLLGTRYLIGTLRALPLDKIKRGELEICRAIKKKKEIQRQKLDQGNIDKLLEELK